MNELLKEEQQTLQSQSEQVLDTFTSAQASINKPADIEQAQQLVGVISEQLQSSPSASINQIDQQSVLAVLHQ